VALPPSQKPGLPGKPGLAKPAAAEDAIAKSRRERDELEAEVQAIEEGVEELKAKYDQYFLGVERREPNRWRDELKKKVLRVKEAFTRNTGLKFRIQSLHARFISYERLWLRSAREKEEGTYRRDLFKARLRAHHDEPPPAEKGALPAKPVLAAAKGAAPPAARAPAASCRVFHSDTITPPAIRPKVTPSESAGGNLPTRPTRKILVPMNTSTSASAYLRYLKRSIIAASAK